MKKINLMFVAAVLLATTAMTSCKKETTEKAKTPNKSADYSTAKTAQEEEDYYDDMIRTVSYGIVDLSADPIFRQTVADLVALQFDGDDNIPLVILDSVLATRNINLQQEMINSLAAHGKQSLVPNVQKAVQGFQYFTNTLYTQIYIPFITGKNIVNTIPAICLNFEDVTILPFIKKAGTGIITTGTANEAFAAVNNVFVVSVNETIGNGKPKLNGGFTGGTGGTARTTAGGDRILQILQVNISDKKEGWGNGRADISFRSICFRPSCNKQDLKSGEPFGKIANGELNSWFSPAHGNLAIANGMPDYWEESKSEVVKIAFYEKDLRHKFKKTITLFACGGGSVDAVSKEDIYGIVELAFSDYTSYTYADMTYDLTGGKFKLRGTKY